MRPIGKGASGVVVPCSECGCDVELDVGTVERVKAFNRELSRRGAEAADAARGRDVRSRGVQAVARGATNGGIMSERDAYGLKLSDSWITPNWIIDAVRAAHPAGMSRIDLDPCAGERATYAIENVRPPEDGLAVEWSVRARANGVVPAYPGLAYVNPPYSARPLARWVEACANQASEQLAVLALVPASTGAGWMFDHVYAKAQGLCWIRGRVRFLDPTTGDLGASVGRGWSVAVWWGPRVNRFFAAFEEIGELGRLVQWGAA